VIPVFYEALDRVNQELVGMIGATVLDAKASSVQKGQAVKIPITPVATNEDVEASSSAPVGSGETIKTVDVTITKIRRGTPILWTGEDELGVSGSGMLNPIQVDQFAQRLRSLRNEMEADVCAETYLGAIAQGNVRGTVGTDPFASNLTNLTQVLKDLEDNGAPTSELQAVLNTQSGMNLRNLTQLQKINEAGETSLLRRGVLGDLFGFALRESAGMKHTAGSATGYLTNSDSLAIGDKEIAIDTGSGTFNAGDVIKFADDNNYYVVESATATKLTLKEGLKTAVGDNKAITVYAYKPNACFARGAIVLASRVPYVPSRGDIAIDRQIITDPVTGIPYELAVWGGAYQNSVTIATAWGCKNIKPENTVALIG
jgi:hypothetical protein